MILMDSEEIVSSLGCTVTTARDGRGALRQLGEHSFDLLFTDIGLPGLSGVELARQARVMQPGLDVLFVSGFGKREDAAEAAPEALFVTKPYSIAELETALRQIAERRG